MRLQVEIATASCTLLARDELAQDRRPRALGQREALAQRERRGLVRDAEGEQLAHRAAPRRAGSLAARRSAASCVELAAARARIAAASRIAP